MPKTVGAYESITEFRVTLFKYGVFFLPLFYTDWTGTILFHVFPMMHLTIRNVLTAVEGGEHTVNRGRRGSFVIIEGMLQNKTCAFAVDPYQLLLTYLSATFLINPSSFMMKFC